jgi:PAS domain-containing protein
MDISITQDKADDLEFRVAIRQSEIRYRRLFEAAHDGVLILDSVSRKITDANPFMSHLLGYRHEELVGKELWEIGLLKDEQASQAAFRELQKSGRFATKICRSKASPATGVKLRSWPIATMRTASRLFSAMSATSPNESGPKLRCARANNASARCSN